VSTEIVCLDRASFLSDPGKVRESLISSEGALVLIQKPYGDTSFHAVNRIRKAISRATDVRRVKCGHAGTLDPLATGLLIIATRGKTKSLAGLIGLDKTYLVRMRLGVTSASFDLEQPIEISGGEQSITKEAVELAIHALPGEHEQIPPIFSAIKQKGRPAYRAARAGRIPIMVARTIVIHEVEIISIELPYISFRARVSKGTYIRSLVRDIATTLGTGGLLIDLEREAIGEWHVKDALTMEEITQILKKPEYEAADPLHHS
jgi:tRNA pseudouridine55 synthase